MEREYLPTPPPPLPTATPLAVFPAHFSLWTEALRSPPHYRQSHFVLRARESGDYSCKTTGSKNDLRGVEPSYLLPLLPLSSNIIRVMVRNVTVWESYITHLSHDRFRAAYHFRLDTWSLKCKWKQSQKINITIFSAVYSWPTYKNIKGIMIKLNVEGCPYKHWKAKTVTALPIEFIDFILCISDQISD